MNNNIIKFINQNFSLAKKRLTLADVIDVEEFLFSRDPQIKLSKGELGIFEHLIKKIEVTKKVYRNYDICTWKPATNELVRVEWIQLFICYSLLLYFSTKDCKYLNAVLKLKDGILKSPIFEINLKFRIFLEEVTENEL